VIEEQFTEACAGVERVYTRLDNATIRKIYAYYKQATEGDVKGKRPGVLRLRDRIKYDSWSSIRGMSKHNAMVAYVELAGNLTLESEAVSCETREASLQE
tara:strand:+ start:1877 stop:2176 length:300 start_codon:yes stop_codon:yes gene_type:complete